MAPGACSSKKLWGLLTRKERWGLSWPGRFLLTFGIVSLIIWIFFSLYPFLAVTHRVNSDILVIEGWVHKYAIRSAVTEFKGGSYRYAFTTGGPVVGNGGYVNDYQTAASVGADLLKESGFPMQSLEIVPSHEMGRDRTYSSAVALRDWFRDHGTSVHSLNVLTEDLHARRTRLLYQEAFGQGVSIGIIAVPSPDYDARRWWEYSEGVKDAVSEGVAYLYAKLFCFSPEPANAGEAAQISQAYH